MKRVIVSLGVVVVSLGVAFALLELHGASARLADGPRSPGPDGPFSASDFDRDGQVTRAEIQRFIEMGPERRYGMVAYFAHFDMNNDAILSPTELAAVTPPFAFDGSDANSDGQLTLAEVTDYANQRLYRQMGLEQFFDLINTDGDDVVTAEEIEAAHRSGQLPRG